MAASKISELIPLLVDQFISEADSHQINESTRKIKDRLTKSVYKRLYTRFNSWLIDSNVTKENYSAHESMKHVIREMESTGNYATAEALSNCMKQLSNDKGHIRENVQVCLRFLIALFNLNITSANKLKDDCLDDTNDNTWDIHYEAKWYNGSKYEPGILHMYSSDIFEMEDPVYNLVKNNHDVPSGDDLSDGLELWTEGMLKDLQQMSHYSLFPSLNELNLLRHNSIDEPSQIVSEYSSWNTPSDEDEDFQERYLREQMSLSTGASQQSFELEEISPFLLLNDAEIFTKDTGDDESQAILTYEDSFYHFETNPNLFLEQQFCRPPILLKARDIANLLIGLSSESFHILRSGKFLNVFAGSDSADIFSGHSMLTNFISSGFLFIRLSDFAQESYSNVRRSVIDALKSGLAKYLLAYEVTVSNTLLEPLEHIGVLNYHFEELCENLRYVAEICGFQDANIEPNEISGGVDFIDHLYEMALSTNSGPTHPTLTFLIKYSFSPYLRFLQHWLFDGVCDDILDEFRLQKNAFYENAKDESYWTSCYTVTGKNVEEFAPVFLKPLAKDILICGKSFNLLKRCCPSHLLFSVDLPTPKLDLGFIGNITRNIQKKTYCTMLSRISCILENLNKSEQTSYDENLNPIDLSDTGLEDKMRSCLFEAKLHVECAMKSIFSEDEIFDILQAENISVKEKVDDSTNTLSGSVNLKPILHNVTNHERRNSWPVTNCDESVDFYDNSAGILMTSLKLSREDFPLRNIPHQQHLDLKSVSNPTKQDSENIMNSNIMSSFSSFIYDEANNPLAHDKEIATVENNLSEEKAINRLIQQLMLDLLDGENVNEEDKHLFHDQHISSLIKLSLYPIMKAQIDLVNRCVLDYFFDVLEMNNHFMVLINFYGLHDGEFGDSLSWQLSKMVKSSRNFCINSIKLDSVLAEALANSINGEMTNVSHLSLHIREGASNANFNTMLDLLKFIKMEYEVQWPCNIIITHAQLSSYNKIFTFMLEIQHVLFISKQMWLYFKKLSVNNNDLGLTSQFRKLQLYRHEMQHFINAFKCYIASEVYDLAWHEFQKVIKEQISNLEDLRTAHSSYISTIIDACLLDRSSQKLLTYLRESFRCMLRFHKLLTESPWYYNSECQQWEHKEFSQISKEFQSYQRAMSTFYKEIVELCHLKYLTHLEHLLLTVDFNRFYKRTS